MLSSSSSRNHEVEGVRKRAKSLLRYYGLEGSLLPQNVRETPRVKTPSVFENTYANAYANLGVVYYKHGKYDEAIASFDKALRIDPNLVEAHTNQGIAYVEQGKYDKAVSSLEKAIELDPENAMAYYNLACTYSLQNKKTTPIEFLQKAITLDKGYIEISKTDSCFDNIRKSSKFQQLVNSV